MGQIFVVFSEYLNTGDTKTFLTYYLTNLEKSYIHIYTIQIGWISQSRYANFCNRLVSYQKRKPLNNMNGKFMICHDLFISCMLQQFLLLYNCTMGSISLINRMYIFRIKTVFLPQGRHCQFLARYSGNNISGMPLLLPPSILQNPGNASAFAALPVMVALDLSFGWTSKTIVHLLQWTRNWRCGELFSIFSTH